MGHLARAQTLPTDWENWGENARMLEGVGDGEFFFPLPSSCPSFSFSLPSLQLYLAPTLHCFSNSRWRPEQPKEFPLAPPKPACTAGYVKPSWGSINMGYWPSFFGQDGWILARSSCFSAQKRTRSIIYPAVLTEQAWSIRVLLYGFRGSFSVGTQRVVPSEQDSPILLLG